MDCCQLSYMTIWSRGLVRSWDNLKSFIISPLPQTLWTSNLASLWLAIWGFHPCHSTLWSNGLTRSHDNLEPLYLHYHNIYGRNTWQRGHLPWLSFTHKVKWTYHHVVLWDHMKNQKHMSPIPPCLAGWWLALSDFYP